MRFATKEIMYGKDLFYEDGQRKVTLKSGKNESEIEFFSLVKNKKYLEDIKVIVIITLFTKLSWPGDNGVTLQSSSQAVTCPPIYYSQWRLLIFPLMLNVKQRSCKYHIF